MIYLTGDVHGNLDIDRYNPYLHTGITTTDKDYGIVLGDMGLLWNSSPDKYEEVVVYNIMQQNHITLFVDGNHENFERLKLLPEVPMFGSVVGKYNDKIYHLKRGNVYTIEDKTFFVMGGAKSIDKANRTEWVSWWKDEIPSYREMYDGIENLRLHDYKVDYILSHTCPKSIKLKYFKDIGAHYWMIDECPVSKYFDSLLDDYKVQFKKWYFGHMHDTWDIIDFEMMYEYWKGIDS